MSSLRRSLLPCLVLLVASCGGEGLSGRTDPAPVVDAGPDQRGAPTETLTFDGMATPSAGHTIVSWAWTFGDGSKATTQSATHAYAAVGTYHVKLVATDELQVSGSATATVTIVASAVTLVPKITGPMTGVVGTSLTLDGSKSTPSSMITTLTWDWGDGATGTGVTAMHAYAAAGTFNVTLTVKDSAGDNATTDPWPIVVTDTAATLPSPSGWSYGKTDPNETDCSGFIAGPLTITVSGTTISIVEGGGVLGNTTYTGTYNPTTRAFTASSSSLGETQGFDCTFSADYRHFTGNYTVNVSFPSCNATIPVTGNRTSPP